jgi:hypothetical protein
LCDLFSREDDEEGMTKHALEELIARLRKKFKSVQEEDAEPAIKVCLGGGLPVVCAHQLGVLGRYNFPLIGSPVSLEPSK